MSFRLVLVPVSVILYFAGSTVEPSLTAESKSVDAGRLRSPDMVSVPAGTFLMGSDISDEGWTEAERPQHRVSVNAFSLGRHTVTFAEWDACVADGGCNGYHPDDQNWGRNARPVVNISWRDAQAYIAWLNGKVLGRASTGSGDGPYRLPTEAEWEYAARAGTSTRYYWGNGSDEGKATCAGCESQGESDRVDPDRTTPVGTLPPNPWGFFDMAGNVWQWTADCWNEMYAGAPSDGRSWTRGNCHKHALRGGSWRDDAQFARSAYRAPGETAIRYGNIGFRLAKDQ